MRGTLQKQLIGSACRPIRSLEAQQAQLLQAELPLPQGSLAEMARADDTDLLEWDRVKADEEDAEGESHGVGYNGVCLASDESQGW